MPDSMASAGGLRPRLPADSPIPTSAVFGPEVRPANRSRDAGSGIHDDATAQAAGFRGGTVAGNIHLDHFPPLLVESFGPAWFERGVLSMYFREPTMHLEPVHAAHAPLAAAGGSAGEDRGDRDQVVDAWFVTPEGGLVGEGAVGLASYPHPTPLRTKDRRPVDGAGLDLLADLPVGETLHVGTTRLKLDRQRAFLADRELLPLPLEWYGESSPWGPPVACPSIAVDALWGPFERALRGRVKPAVGLYGAIELHHRNGPLLAGVDYDLTGVVTEVSDSPRTEIFWAETTAALDGDPVASLVMMIRMLK